MWCGGWRWGADGDRRVRCVAASGGADCAGTLPAGAAELSAPAINVSVVPALPSACEPLLMLMSGTAASSSVMVAMMSPMPKMSQAKGSP